MDVKEVSWNKFLQLHNFHDKVNNSLFDNNSNSSHSILISELSPKNISR